MISEEVRTREPLVLGGPVGNLIRMEIENEREEACRPLVAALRTIEAFALLQAEEGEDAGFYREGLLLIAKDARAALKAVAPDAP